MSKMVGCLLCHEEFGSNFRRHFLTHRVVWTRFLPTDALSCWPWTGSIDRRGYGRISLGSRYHRGHLRAHRYVYEAIRGPVEPNLQMDHLCRNRRCVNPNHLEPVTDRVNTLRGEGLTAQNARKTHCKRGHSFDDVNTYVGNGRRHCRPCNRVRDRQSKEQRLAVAA